MRTAVVLPVKRFAQAKQRLGASLADPLRRDLAQAMVGDVLDAIASVEAIDLTLVVTREPAVAAATRELDALIVEDAEQGQSAAVVLGIARAMQEGTERVLCIPGDCPALAPNDLRSLLRAQAEVVIVPDRHGTGTNGLLLAPPSAIAPSFGPGSCERHIALARDAGATWKIMRPSSLLLDVDTGADLAALREQLEGERVSASRTSAVLDMIEQRAWEPSHSAA